MRRKLTLKDIANKLASEISERNLDHRLVPHIVEDFWETVKDEIELAFLEEGEGTVISQTCSANGLTLKQYFVDALTARIADELVGRELACIKEEHGTLPLIKMDSQEFREFLNQIANSVPKP